MKDIQKKPIINEDGDPAADQGKAGPPPEPRNAVERLYDRIPVTVKQVDRFIRVMVVVLLLVLILAIVNGTRG